MNLPVPLALFKRVWVGCLFLAGRLSTENRTIGGHHYDPVEICFFCDYWRVPRPDALKSWQIEVWHDDRVGQRPKGFIRPVNGAGGADSLLIENCVARLALNAIEDRLPQRFARMDEDKLVSSRKP